MECVVCLEAKDGTTLCCGIYICQTCFPKTNKCPICQKEIEPINILEKEYEDFLQKIEGKKSQLKNQLEKEIQKYDDLIKKYQQFKENCETKLNKLVGNRRIFDLLPNEIKKPYHYPIYRNTITNYDRFVLTGELGGNSSDTNVLNHINIKIGQYRIVFLHTGFPQGHFRIEPLFENQDMGFTPKVGSYYNFQMQYDKREKTSNIEIWDKDNRYKSSTKQINLEDAFEIILSASSKLICLVDDLYALSLSHISIFDVFSRLSYCI